MELTIKQKPFGYFKLTPYLVFVDGELVGKVHRFRPLSIHVEKEEFYLTIKDHFFYSTQRCKIRDSDIIVFETIDNFPFCLYLLYCLSIIVLTFLHVNLYIPDNVIIASLFLFPAFIGVFGFINRKNYFVIENMKGTYTYANGKMISIMPDGKPRLIDFKDISFCSCDKEGTFLMMKNGERIQQNSTLSEIENLIPSEYWIRVNRQTIVMRDCIVRYNPSALCVNMNGKHKVIHYFATKPEEILGQLKTWNPKLYSSENFNGMEEDDDVVLTEELKRLQEYFDKNPKATAQQVANDLHFSIRTAQRRIAELKKTKQS